MSPNLHALPNHRATNFALPLIFWIVFATQSAAAQTTGDLVGQVRDSGGKGLRDVTVKVVNTVNGIGAATKTNDRGDFVVPDLSPGDYRIVATKENYRPVCQPVLSILLDRKNPVPAPHIKFGSAGNDPACRNLRVQSSRRNLDARAADSLAGAAPEAAEVGDRGPYAPSAIIVVLEREPDDVSSESGSQQGNPAANAAPAVSDAPIGSIVNTVDATRGSNFTAKQIEALPLGAASYMRAFDDLALLAPGVAPPPYTPGVRGPGVGFGIGTAGQFSVNGARARSNNFSVDGSDTNDPDVGVRRGGYVAQVPQSLESIQEVSISTLLWSAQLGRNSGSQVNAVSKYGGNDFHGQVYGFFNDSRLNARNFFDYTGGASGGKDPFTRTQAGFVVGGPLVRDRTQFFGSFGGAKINASTEQHFASPTLDERRLGTVENFSQSGDVSTLTSPIPRGVLNSFPEPKGIGGPYGRNTFTEVLPADGEGIVTSVRFTHQVAERHTLNARYNLTDDRRVLPSVNRAIHSTIGANTRSQSLSLILDSQIASRLFNQARFSFGRTRGDFPEHPLATFNPSRTFFLAPGICGFLPNGKFLCTGGLPSGGITQPIGEIIIEPFSPLGVNALLFPQGRVNNTFQYADTLSWHWHDHSLKFGADLRRVQLNSFQDRLYRPQISFGYGLGEPGRLDVPVQDNKFKPSFTPQGGLVALSSLGLGMLMPTSALQTLTAGVPDSHIGLHIAEYQLFINDHWRVRHNFTLNYGLRYEYNTVPHDSHNRIEDALTLRSLPAPGDTTGPEIKMKYERVINAYRKVLDGRTGIYDPDLNNFGPRVGFAWDPRSDAKTVLRSGYGIYYDAMLGAVVSQSRSVFPNEIPVGIDRPQPGYLDLPASCVTVVCIPIGDKSFEIKTNQLQGGPGAFAQNIATLSDQIRAGLAFTLPAKNLPTSYAQQWHLSFEREIGNGLLVSTAYVGAKGTKLTRLVTPNLGPSSTPFARIATTRTPALPLSSDTSLGDPYRPSVLLDYVHFLQPSSRPVPELGTYQIFENSAGSIYHALQIEAMKRYGSGFNFTLAYTWSHAIDDVSDLFPIAGAPVLAQSQTKLKTDRGNANFDVRHRLATSFVWNLPFYRNSKNGSARWLGGWQVSSIFQAQTGQPFTLNIPIDANLDGNVTDRPATTDGLIIFDGHGRQRVSATKPLESYFVLGQDGVIGRNTLRGDSFINLDLALTKTFRFADTRKLDFRTELFNLFNRANFGLPVRILDAPGFGWSADTVSPARMIQFALKLSF